MEFFRKISLLKEKSGFSRERDLDERMTVVAVASRGVLRRRRNRKFARRRRSYSSTASLRRVGILRRRNAIHKILKFRHVVSRRKRARPASENVEQRRRRRRRDDVVYFRNRVRELLARFLMLGYVAHIFLSSRLFLHLRF